ncbi:MAG: hypothetical protein KAS32_26255 [Candidatus Peribacteraceae bacterium]|nr:hypothetical protein [Candidatus Peribacteraceae bacterium]
MPTERFKFRILVAILEEMYRAEEDRNRAPETGSFTLDYNMNFNSNFANGSIKFDISSLPKIKTIDTSEIIKRVDSMGMELNITNLVDAIDLRGVIL